MWCNGCVFINCTYFCQTLQEEFFTPPNHSALDNDLSSDRKPPGATAVPFSAEETAEGDDYKHIPIVPISEPGSVC